VTTMAMQRTRMDVEWCPRWATVVHGSVLAALVAGLTAIWVTLALVAALLVAPVETTTAFAHKGAWALSDAVRQGTDLLLGGLDTAARLRATR
jgi:hypothetical protein